MYIYFVCKIITNLFHLLIYLGPFENFFSFPFFYAANNLKTKVMFKSEMVKTYIAKKCILTFIVVRGFTRIHTFRIATM